MLNRIQKREGSKQANQINDAIRARQMKQAMEGYRKVKQSRVAEADAPTFDGFIEVSIANPILPDDGLEMMAEAFRTGRGYLTQDNLFGGGAKKAVDITKRDPATGNRERRKHTVIHRDSLGRPIDKEGDFK